MNKLKAIASALLTDHLPDSFKQIIDNLLQSGISHGEIIRRVRKAINELYGNGQTGKLTLQTVKTYLKSKRT